MQTATEITSNLKNLRYYSQKIAELSGQQLNMDFARAQEIGINAGPGSIRFDCLLAIQGACKYIDVYAENISINLESAIKQDKVLHIDEEEDARATKQNRLLG